jgi:hypothetical protein
VPNASHDTHFTIAELTPGVYTRTSISAVNHAALRAGFAGYTANPRWNASKFHAWKTGRQWRHALNSQEMVIREMDSMLVHASEGNSNPSESTEGELPPSTSAVSSNHWFNRKRGAIASLRSLRLRPLSS